MARPATKSRANAAAHPILRTQADVDRGAAALAQSCRYMRKAHKTAGNPPLRRVPDGFLGLARIIVFQQVSSASGNAIWARVLAGIEPFEAGRVLAMSDEALRGLGLSRPKVRSLRAVSEAVAGQAIDLAALARAPEEEVRERLTALHGIGPWSANIYLMFCLGRADSFAAGDLALQEAARMLMRRDERPSADELEEIAERWRPWRGVAAGLLWAYYRVAKGMPGGAPV
jgi:DNA-3-methyladenine glycosylase II